jgi:hypothetical protein
MGLLDLLRGDGRPARTATLAADAHAMRTTLDALRRELEAAHRGTWVPDLRPLLRDLLEGEVEAPTADVAALRRDGTDPDEFYERELAPNWDGLSQEERATKIERFMRLSNSLGELHRGGEPPDLIVDMIATVHLKVLLLSWAYDRTYSFIDRIVSNPAQFGTNGGSAG